MRAHLLALAVAGCYSPAAPAPALHNASAPVLALELNVGPQGPVMGFMATVVQPNLAPDPEGGFVGTESYCHLSDGVVERSDRGWHASTRLRAKP